MCSQIYVVDSAFFIEEHREKIRTVYTSPKVMEEIRSLKAKLRLELFDIQVYMPSKSSISFIEKASKELGELKLSKADLEILALAHELNSKYNVILLSDDYSIQNLARYLGIKFRSVSKKAISKMITWENFCLVCGKKLPLGSTSCIYCGSNDVGRRPRKRS
ncbi:MAG TPA: PIN domain-containing protein [Geobacterales bacterium]|nr:PIN domain-containing protein [Geobacterales bacterium]